VREPRTRAVKKEPHAKRFGTLDDHEAHVAANMIGILEPIDQHLVARRISLQSCDSILNGPAEARTDLIAILHGAIHDHVNLRSLNCLWQYCVSLRLLKYFSSLPIVVTNGFMRQITVLVNLGNRLPQNETEFAAYQHRQHQISKITPAFVSDHLPTAAKLKSICVPLSR
jgi:hypothetical protein